MTAEPTVLVCVGATKSGTSWLYRHLLAHPDCHFRTIKELHYFDMTKAEHFSAAAARLARQAEGLSAELAGAEGARRISLARRLADVKAWQAVVARGDIDLDAYRGYLLDGRKQESVVGDVTPSYALLGQPRLRRIAALGAGLKVLFLMRDPVARAWSHIRMVAERAGDAFEVTARQLLAQLVGGAEKGEARGIAARGDYRAIVPRLKAVFAPGALKIAFSETLLTPEGIGGFWRWLGIGKGPLALDRKVWESRALDMTSDEAGALRRWLAPQYEFVSGLGQALPAAWIKNMEKGLA